MAEREIRVVTADVDAERSLRLARRRHWRLAERLRGRQPVARLDGELYWPIDLAVASAAVKLPFRAARPVELPTARDAVTGRPGLVDRAVPDIVTAVVRADQVLVAGVDGVDPVWREFARDRIVRRFRPSRIDDLRLARCQRVHLPYHVVRVGAAMLLVDRLTGRVDAPGRHRALRTLSGRPIGATAGPR